MFVGMCVCLPIHVLTNTNFRRWQRRKSESSEEGTSLQTYSLIALPALFDMIGTTLSGLGLLWVDASIYQMLRGAEMIFAAILSVKFLRRKIFPYHIVALLGCVVALTMVGVASVFSSSAADGNPVLMMIGIAMIVLGQLVQATQCVMEEHLLCNLSAPPLVIIGMEGVWGMLLSALALLGFYFTRVPGDIAYNADGVCEENCANSIYHEDSADTFTKLRGSGSLQLVIALYVVAIVLYNICGIKITQHTSAGHRTVLEACRTFCIWVVDLFIYYGLGLVGNGSPGEAWDEWSWMQLAGFLLLVLGTFVYNRVFELPGFYYPPLDVPLSAVEANDDFDEESYFANIQEKERLMGDSPISNGSQPYDMGNFPDSHTPLGTSLPLSTTPHR